MKNILSLSLAAFVCGLFLASPLLRADDAAYGGMDKADPPKAGADMKAGSDMKAGGMDMDMMGMGVGMLEKMKDKLKLSDGQMAKLKDAQKAHMDSSKAMMDTMKEKSEKLEELLKKNASDDELSAVISSMKADRKAMMDSQDGYHDAIQAVLTPRQQAEWIVAMHEKMHGMMGQWKKEKMEKMEMKDKKMMEKDEKGGM